MLIIAWEYSSLSKLGWFSTLVPIIYIYTAKAIDLKSLIIGGYAELVPFITIFNWKAVNEGKPLTVYWYSLKVASSSAGVIKLSSEPSVLNGVQETKGGIQAARDATEVIFALIQSELSNGSKINLPVEGSQIILKRNISSRKPKFS